MSWCSCSAGLRPASKDLPGCYIVLCSRTFIFFAKSAILEEAFLVSTNEDEWILHEGLGSLVLLLTQALREIVRVYTRL